MSEYVVIRVTRYLWWKIQVGKRGSVLRKWGLEIFLGALVCGCFPSVFSLQIPSNGTSIDLACSAQKKFRLFTKGGWGWKVGIRYAPKPKIFVNGLKILKKIGELCLGPLSFLFNFRIFSCNGSRDIRGRNFGGISCAFLSPSPGRSFEPMHEIFIFSSSACHDLRSVQVRQWSLHKWPRRGWSNSVWLAIFHWLAIWKTSLSPIAPRVKPDTALPDAICPAVLWCGRYI